MKERPILFMPEMVQAYLASRKRQIRRIIKPEWYRCLDLEDPDDVALALAGCPYGKPGDSLWVKETHTWITLAENEYVGAPRLGPVLRKPDGLPVLMIYRADALAEEWEDQVAGNWRPSIFMPRWASRIQFPILKTWIEPVQEISEADAIAEGVAPNWCGPLDGWLPTEHGYIDYSLPDGWDGEGAVCLTAQESYRTLWDKINAKRGYGWDVSPWWVWVIEFPVKAQ